MQVKRANLEICKKITCGELIHGQRIGDKTLIIPTPGYYGYFFQKESIAFSMEKVRMIQRKTNKIVDVAKLLQPQNELKLTQELAILDYDEKKTARRLKKKETDVWVNTAYIKNIIPHRCKFYQDKKNPLGIILITENNQPVMCVLPVRIYTWSVHTNDELPQEGDDASC